MKFNQKIKLSALSKISGGKKVDFFGSENKAGNYTKCDFCGRYGAMPLLNHKDTCLNCLGKITNIVGKSNIMKLISLEKPIT